MSEWFNTSAFAAPAPGYFGNAGNGIITGPGLINFDVALFKDFLITERHRLQFRAEMFNVLNHTNFRSVDTTFGSGTFGQVVRPPTRASRSSRCATSSEAGREPLEREV